MAIKSKMKISKPDNLSVLRLGVFGIMAVLFLSCERIVDIENPYPEKAKFCLVNDTLMGRWQSDSVWVTTRTDTTDTIFVNKRPTYFFDLMVNCDDDTGFVFNYINFSGVVTREVYSVNFETNDSVLRIFDELDFERELEESILEIPFEILSESAFRGQYSQELNADQRTETQFWMRRVN